MPWEESGRRGLSSREFWYRCTRGPCEAIEHVYTVAFQCGLQVMFLSFL